MSATDDGWIFNGGLNSNRESDRASSSENKWGNAIQNKIQNAKSLARQAENGAGDNSGNGNGLSSLMQAREAEKAKSQSGIINNVKGGASTKLSPNAKIKSKLKQYLPTGIILGILTLFMMLLSGAQGLAPIAFLMNGLNQFNHTRELINKRSTYFMRYSFNSERNVRATRATIFGKEKFKIGKSLSSRMQKQGIHFVDTSPDNPSGVRFLAYQDEKTGKYFAIGTNDADVGKLPDSAKIMGEDGVLKEVFFETDHKIKLDDALDSIDGFFRAFDKATRTIKGHIAGWFDDLSKLLHKKIGSSRNKQRDTKKIADEEEVRENARKKDQGLSEDLIGEDGNYGGNSEEDNPKVSDDGKSSADLEKGDLGATKKDEVKFKQDNEVNTAVESKIRNKAQLAIGAAGNVTNLACTTMKIYSAIDMIVAGMHIANVLNYTTGFLEAINKTQAGDAGKAELATYMNDLTRKGTTKDSEGNIIENKNAFMTTAWNQFFSSGAVKVDPKDKMAEKFNKEYVMKQAISGKTLVSGEGANLIAGSIAKMGGYIQAYKNCLTAQRNVAIAGMATEIASLLLDVTTLISTGGVGNVIKSTLKGAVKSLFESKTVKALGFAIVTGAVIQAVIPHIAQWLKMDLISGASSVDKAYALNSGWNIYMGKQTQMSSGLPANAKRLAASQKAQNEIIANEAKYERLTKSPFDITSKNTFLGNIVNSLMPIANVFNSPLAMMSTATKTIGKMTKQILPKSYAEGSGKAEQTNENTEQSNTEDLNKAQTSTNYDCPNLSQLELVGDAFCNPYYTTDMSTIDKEPSAVMEDAMNKDDLEGRNGNFIWDNVEENGGNPEINPGSELSKWVVACAARDSQPGVVDPNIMASVQLINTGNSTVDNILETGTSMIPVIGNLVDLKNSLAEGQNLGWATGQSCLTEEGLNYSRYSDDQRTMESMGIIEKSAVSKFLEKFYEKNPLDNSKEGIIARYAGMTKKQVIATLETVEYLNYIAKYDATGRGPERKTTKQIIKDEIGINKGIIKTKNYLWEETNFGINLLDHVANKKIYYADLRSKNQIA